MPSLLGLGAALLSPLMMVIGFIIWDKHWLGSAFALNIFKCSFASLMLLVMVLSTGGLNLSAMFLSHTGLILVLSAMLGIVIGDNTWLMSLKLLGARRVIVVDAMKPWLAAVLGHFLLGEEITPMGMCGIFVTIVGVVVVSLEGTTTGEQKRGDDSAGLRALDTAAEGEGEEEEGEEEEGEGEALDHVELISDSHGASILSPVESSLPLHGHVNSSSSLLKESRPRSLWRFCSTSDTVSRGYLLAVLNVVLDCLGAVLVKMYGEDFSTWEINLIRFGSSAVVMGALAAAGRLAFEYRSSSRSSSRSRSRSRSKAIGDSLMLPGGFTSDAVAIMTYAPERLAGSPEALMQEDRRQLFSDAPATDVAAVDTPTACYADATAKAESESEAEAEAEVRDSYWFNMPLRTTTRADWSKVSLGVVFVTFLCPVLSIYALFTMDVALCLTLTSLGPVYSLPLVFLMKDERVTSRGVAGTVVACVGVVMLTIPPT